MIVVTGSELVRGERPDLNGPFLARSLLALGLEPARIEIVGDDPGELETALRDALASADLVACSGGLGPTHDDRTVEIVAKVAGLELRVDEELEAADRRRLPHGRRAAEAAVRGLRGGRAQAGDAALGRGVPRARRDRARPRRRRARNTGDRPARPSGRAAAALAEGARGRLGATCARPRHAAAAADAALLRPRRVAGRAGVPGGGRRRRRARGDDLRPGLRDPRRPRRRAGRRGAHGRARGGARRAARPLPLLDGRPDGRGARARPLPRPRLPPGDRRVLHRGPDRGPAHLGARARRT